MKQKLLIVGAGSVGKFIAYNCEHFLQSYEIIGFLDDDPQKQQAKIAGYDVIGKMDTLAQYSGKNIALVLGIAFPKVKLKIVEQCAQFDFEFPNLISKHAWISEHVTFGKGCIIYPGVSINYGTQIGDFVVMNMNCAIGHDSKIEDYAALAPGVNLGGHSHLRKGVDMGIGSSTIQNVEIGDFTVVGGQSMIVHSVQPDSKVIGVPGKIIAKK
jgi:sugar O-acyltransferase (sialic acid O-acetyltransferase NeuD family)